MAKTFLLCLSHRNIIHTPRVNPPELRYERSTLNDVYEVDDPTLTAMNRDELDAHLKEKGMKFDAIVFWDELSLRPNDNPTGSKIS